MKHSLKSKLILSYLGVALLTVVVVSILIRLTSGQSLMNLVVQQQTSMLNESAQVYYTAYGTMDGFYDFYLFSGAALPNSEEPDYKNKPPESREIRGLHGLVDANSRALIPFAGYNIGDYVPEEQMSQSVPVEVDGQTVAWILPDTKYQFALNAEEQLFLQRTNLAIGLAAVAGVLAAVIIGFLLASKLIKPIRRLTSASQEMARGELQQELPVTSQDELGQLTTTFNKMSADLFEADQKRKRMTADITHDLSTPLQIISGYIEMLEAGEVTLSPERIEVIKTEIEHLRRLVGDMTTLTQAESGGLDMQPQPVNPASLLEHIYRTYEPITAQKGVSLILDITRNLPAINVDEGRIIQVLKNLVENALRYTPSGGTIRLSAGVDNKVRLRVSDSGDGIEAEDLPYVFDRFYRADKNRVHSSGKMGLGLAICKALVNAQGGTISAESGGKGQGTTIVISFDAEKKTEK
jgi:signal transduction histidine kinase